MLNKDYRYRLRYLWDDGFKIKWGILRYLVQACSYLYPYRILDLGCGPITIKDYLNPKDIKLYVGIDHEDPVIHERLSEGGTYLIKKIEHLKGEELKKQFGRFNIIFWAGIGTNSVSWPGILNTIMPCLEERGIIILEYHDKPPGILNRIHGVKDMRHVNGLRYDLEYVPLAHMPDNPTVYQRRAEVFMKQWGAVFTTSGIQGTIG